MRLFCWYCHESVSSELPDNAIFRAIAVCPECIARSDEAAQLQRAVDPPSAPRPRSSTGTITNPMPEIVSLDSAGN